MQNKRSYSIVGLVGGLFTHESFFVGMYSWLFDKGWNYPFYSSGFLTCTFAFLYSLVGLFLVSLGYMIRKLLVFQNPNEQICFLSLSQNCLLSVLYAAHLNCMAYSIYQTDMNTSRYLILSLATDPFWICIMSPLVLKRQITF